MPELAVLGAVPATQSHLDVPGPRCSTLSEVAEQLGMSRDRVYELMYKGEFASIQIPSSESDRRATRRVERFEVDACIARYRVSTPENHGGVL